LALKNTETTSKAINRTALFFITAFLLFFKRSAKYSTSDCPIKVTQITI